VISGENLQFGFLEENGGRVIINTLKTGDTQLVPYGMIHYAQNLGCTPAVFLASYNSEDPGVVSPFARILKDFPSTVVSATMDLTDDQIEGKIIIQIAHM
jgi:oxalate decarboxylase/phosphoglucose isomerase-like protein (cupin superfamily)